MLCEPISRRSLATFTLGGLCGSGAITCLSNPAAATTAPHNAPESEAKLADLEARGGGRLGVFAVDTASGSSIAYRADELFPMCSTHKMLVGAAILSGVEEGRFQLDQRIPYGAADILEYAPVTTKNLTAGDVTPVSSSSWT